MFTPLLLAYGLTLWVRFLDADFLSECLAADCHHGDIVSRRDSSARAAKERSGRIAKTKRLQEAEAKSSGGRFARHVEQRPPLLHHRHVGHCWSCRTRRGDSARLRSRCACLTRGTARTGCTGRASPSAAARRCCTRLFT